MSQTVPFVDLARQHEPLAAQLQDAFARLVRSSGFILGSEVEAFEHDFAAAVGTRHCVGLSSGTAALAVALRAAGVGPGDEVVVPAHTFIASALAVVHAGATPVLCDVDEPTGLIDVASAEAAVSDRTAAIVAVHLYGQPCDMFALRALGERRGLAIVEDAAQAHGAEWNGRPAGSLGTVGCFSFYPSKNLGALGDGGALCTDDDDLARRARALRNLGQHRKGEHELLGGNERLDGLQAALLRIKLPHLAAWNRSRAQHAEAYRRGLPSELRLLPERPQAHPVHHLFPVRTPRRDALAAWLSSQGVDTGLHYSPAIHAHPALRGLVHTPVELDRAEQWAAEELSLPMFAELRSDEVERVVEACRAGALV